jgi:hypothetical protein
LLKSTIKIRQDGLDGCAKLSGLRQPVPGLAIHDHSEKEPHESPPDVWHTSYGKLDSFKPFSDC